MLEIERKFLVKKLPTLDESSKVIYERYFVSDDPNNQIRIQRKNSIYEIEAKKRVGNNYEKAKTPISKEDFAKLTKDCKQSIKRISYKIPGFKNATLKVYDGQFTGLIRAEFEFSNDKDAKGFTPPDWVGKEITNSVLGLDAKLIKLTKAEFLKELQGF